ncbi:SH3 domain-containing protein [Gongronella butleri]|nr:SH3 domain-containing protein [Gongronella butleri]
MVDLAAHILASVQRDLLVLKEHRVIDENAYQAIIAQLPGASSLAPPRPSSAVPSPSPGQAPVSPRPPLPTRRSTSSSTASHHTTPIPAPRTSNVPKLPSRKTGDWQETANSMTPPLPPPAAVPTPLAAASMPMPAPLAAPLAAPTPPARSTSPRPPPAPATNQQIAEAIYDYHGEDPATDLSFRKGDTIVVTEHVNQDWWRGTLNGASGIFPKNHVQE